ncbi:preprotein translocase subunit SecG [Thiohalophilus thiocyanatoxydans]|uniref:Protein-export membrane protein SecG n=1 Tax=Thiohalophilus thiocyanatoxydans TaxID=381308 RepID=A0A4R8INL7_9GAMM|nr:preprotein translocase subunit SecG [Thiohalophilus thiocyanatoxydans]TDY02481.1 preprotein translocase subunit SecG [Thiohalophilus thiocyanatoxydans]
MLYNIILVLHVIVAVALVVLVLLQQGKGADAGAAFGSGASGTVFGSRGAANFLTRTTGVLAFLFFALSLALFTLAGDVGKSESIVDQSEQQSQEQESRVPAAPQEDEPEQDNGAPADVPKSD